HVLAFYDALDAAKPQDCADVLTTFCAPDFLWRGMHPFHEQRGAQAVADVFWTPLKRSFTPIQRRPDIFFAGENDREAGGTWVVQMGHLLGNFDVDWLGIRATRKMNLLRYVEFHRIENGLIAETASFCDILGVILQAGYDPLPAATGAEVISPAPRTQDGVLLSQQDEASGPATLALINAMVTDLISGGVSSGDDHISRFWHDDMCWFGPAGIGASAWHHGYARGHRLPFQDGLEFVRHNGHQCRAAEGAYGGFFGYPSLTMRSTGGFLGLTASDTQADMRIVDLYRRDGDKLAENWIFIDILHFLNMQGVDVLARLAHP
ncbi:MAG: nuclear transport factor 2 family protein, partial [Pseudomonadota bacterium]